MLGLAWRAWGKDQQELVQRLQENDVLRSQSVEHAFRLVDRARFLPLPLPSSSSSSTPSAATTAAALRDLREQAYIDAPCKIGKVHLSAPHMYALVLEKLRLRPGMRVLNIGSGSGYLSCMMAVLVGASGASHGVELQEEVVAHARKCTKKWLRKMAKWRKEQTMQETDTDTASSASASQSASASASAAAASAASTPGADQGEPDRHHSSSELSSEDESDITSSVAVAVQQDDPESVEAEAEQSDEEISESEARRRRAAAAAASFPLLSSYVELSSNGGAPTRGILGPAADLVLGPRRSPSSGSRGQRRRSSSGSRSRRDAGEEEDEENRRDEDAENALRRSVMPIETFLAAIISGRAQGVPHADSDPDATSDAGSEATHDASMSPSPEVRSPSPTPSPPPPAGQSDWHPSFPVPVPAAPLFIAGDAFDVAPALKQESDEAPVNASAVRLADAMASSLPDTRQIDPRCLYDRIYVGAAAPMRTRKYFAQLLVEGGKLVGPFDSRMQLITKLKGGKLKVETIAEVGYADLHMRSREAAVAARNKPLITFPPPTCHLPQDFPYLPRTMQRAIDTCLMLQRRAASTCLPGRLPLPLWLHILSFLQREWYISRIPCREPWSRDYPSDLARVEELLQRATDIPDVPWQQQPPQEQAQQQAAPPRTDAARRASGSSSAVRDGVPPLSTAQLNQQLEKEQILKQCMVLLEAMSDELAEAQRVDEEEEDPDVDMLQSAIMQVTGTMTAAEAAAASSSPSSSPTSSSSGSFSPSSRSSSSSLRSRVNSLQRQCWHLALPALLLLRKGDSAQRLAAKLLDSMPRLPASPSMEQRHAHQLERGRILLQQARAHQIEDEPLDAMRCAATGLGTLLPTGTDIRHPSSEALSSLPPSHLPLVEELRDLHECMVRELPAYEMRQARLRASLFAFFARGRQPEDHDGNDEMEDEEEEEEREGRRQHGEAGGEGQPDMR